MPDRRHRAGARPGDMSVEFRAALSDEIQRLDALADPAEKVRAVSDFFAALDEQLERAAEVRLHALADLRRAGLTYHRIADETGLSVPRVAQLSRAMDLGGRATPPE